MPSFTVHGTPVGKGRPRFVRATGRTYTDDKTLAYEDTVKAVAVKHFPAPLTGPVRLVVECTFEIPRSWSKKKKAAMLGRLHCQKPDTSNIVKAIEDGLNRIAYADDSQVADQRGVKRWGLEARTVVTVEQVGEGLV